MAVPTSDRTGISVAVPSFERGLLLVDTLERVLELDPPAQEVLVVDQTPRHQPAVDERLGSWRDAGQIRWLRRSPPSIPAAMNEALRAAAGPVVLFLDDDVIPGRGLLAAHRRAHASGVALVAGRVIQPWHADQDPERGGDEPPRTIEDEADRTAVVIGANFSVDRSAAIAAGGFDENFVATAYRFEADFARRFAAAGGRVLYAPAAALRHLQALGGTRAGRRSLFAVRARQAQGEYYFLLRAGRWGGLLAALARRPLTAITPRHRQRRVADLLGALPAELLAVSRAARLHRRGPRLLGPLPDGLSAASEARSPRPGP